MTLSPESLVIWRGNHKHDSDDIDNIISSLIDIPESKRECGVGILYTSFFIKDIFERPEVVLVDSYKDIVSQIITDLNLGSGESSFNYWTQVYDGEHNEHMHFSANIPISFVHFVRPTEKKCFHFVGSDGKKHYPQQDEGDIIAFPSWALHAIDESYGNMRMTIAGNILFTSISTPKNDFTSRITVVREGLYITENFN